MNDALTSFLYYLILTEVPAGKLEGLVHMAVASPEPYKPNERLLEYAVALAEILKNAASDDLLNDVIEGKNISDDELTKLEQQIMAQNKNQPASIKSPTNSIEDVKSAVEQLRADGNLTEEDAKRIAQELQEVENTVKDEE